MPIRSSVGTNGTNQSADVKFVQYLLNDWSLRNDRGVIAIDGMIGPETTGAIEAFQEQNTGIVDGRVDPHGPALRQLEALHAAALIDSIRASQACRGYAKLKPGLRYKQAPPETPLAEAVRLCFEAIRNNLD